MARSGMQGVAVKKALKALILLPLSAATAYARTVARWWPSAGFAWTDRAYELTRDAKATVSHPQSGGGRT